MPRSTALSEAKVTGALERADLGDELQALRGRRLREIAFAILATAFLPVWFLVEAALLWRDAWPEGSLIVLAIMLAATVLSWRQALQTHSKMKSLRRPLDPDSLESP